MQHITCTNLATTDAKVFMAMLKKGKVEITSHKSRIGLASKTMGKKVDIASEMAYSEFTRTSKIRIEMFLDHGCIKIHTGYGEGNVKNFYIKK